MTKSIRSLIPSITIVLALTSCSFFNTTQNPAIMIQPTASLSQLVTIELTVQADTSVPFNAVGQIINFTYAIKNTGSTSVPGIVAVTGATVTCPNVNTIGNKDSALDVSETLICTSAYPITQADLDKGSVTFIATANVNGINSNPVTTTVLVVQPKALTLTTSANPVTYSQAGQQIIYTYVIKNSGSQSLGPAQFTVSDNHIGAAPFNCGDGNASMAPNATVTCTATYTITQADVSAVSVTNTATASGGGAGPSQAASAMINKNNVVQPNPSNLVSGSTIQHTVVAGEWLWQIARCYGADPNKVIQANPQLSNPAQISPNTTITVPNIGSVGKIYGPPCVGTHTVQSGDTWNSIALKYNADPTVLQMVNSSTLTVGSVIKVPLNSAGSTSTSTSTVSKGLALTTTANPLTYGQVGQQITYTYVIKNNGNVTLGPAQFTVSDSLISPAPFNCGDVNTTLAPNATVTCTATYTITQADVTAVSVTNTATASGGGAGSSQAASATINKGNQTLTLNTAANPSTYQQAGQQITYTYVITNSGSVTLGPAQFTVSDSLINAAPFNCGDANATLAPNATVTCTATYTITQANVTAASVTNTATASGGGAGPSQAASATINKQ